MEKIGSGRTKYSLVMTPTLCKVAGAISLLQLRIHEPVHLLAYLHRITSVLGDWPVDV